MKVVTINMELIIDDDNCGDTDDSIADYLNDKLLTNPEFFGPENITEVVTHDE